MKTWRADRTRTLGDVLAHVFADQSALAQGRVFVDRARVTDAALAVSEGALVEEIGRAHV